MPMDNKKVVIIECACSGINHAAQLVYFPPTKSEPYPSLYLSTNMPYPEKWYRRIWLALKYIWLNSDCGFLGMEHSYTAAGARKQIELLQEYVKTEEEVRAKLNGKDDQ